MSSTDAVLIIRTLGHPIEMEGTPSMTTQDTEASYRRRQWLAVATLLATPLSIWAQAYPERMVRVIVPYSPGGSLDIAMRIIAQQLSLQTEQQFVVENITGAGGDLGVATALKAPADGYTLLSSGPNLTTNPYLSKNAKFDPIASFTHIVRLVIDASTLAVPIGSTFQTLSELVAYAKTNPGKLSYGSSGIGTPGHMAMELFKRRAEVDIRHIPYRGGGSVINDAVGGQLDMVLIGSSVLAPHIRNGKLRGLGTTTPQRFFTVPEVPAISETYPGFEAFTWIGISARGDMPREAVRTLEQQIQSAMARPEVQARFRAAGLQPAFLVSEEFINFVVRDTETNRKLIAEKGITAD
jgi:tripartite-type tricarboxylate transporter receptor subunit TctC